MMNQGMNMMTAPGTQLRNDLMMPGSATGVTVHVGNIDKGVSDMELKAYFDRVVKVMNLKIIRDMNSQESKGFAFVTLANQQDAENARHALNHEKIGRKEILISFNKKTSGSEADANANVIVKNLDKRVSGRELEKVCSEFGKVLTCKVKDDEEGNSLGYGYVQYDSEESANNCLQRIGGKTLYDKQLIAEKFVPMNRRPTSNQRFNLYIKQFPDSMNQKQIEDFIDEKFSKFGKIASRGVFQDPKINKHYSFVAFEDADKAKEAQAAMNDYQFPGTEDKLFVDFAQTKFQRRQLLEQQHLKSVNETNIYIRSLKKGTTENEIRTVFGKYGPISSICVKENELPGLVGGDKKVLGYAFINFENAPDARQCMIEGKRDNDVLALLDPYHDRSVEFLFFAQSKQMRAQYMRMQKRHTSRSPDANPDMKQMQELMKMFQFYMMQSQQQKKGGKPDHQGNFNKKPKGNQMMGQQMVNPQQAMSPAFGQMQQVMFFLFREWSTLS